MSVRYALLIAALVCFLIAAAGVPTGRVGVVALGLAFWLLAQGGF